jgi:hypothetical protein
MSDIFISYASADREHARQLADALIRRGYSVWWDRTIPPGRVFDEVIQEAIQAARCMIVLWSADSVRSNWVKTEAAEGVARGMLVPALLSEVMPPIEFKRIQSANLARWRGDEVDSEYRNLLDSIERMMKQAPRAAADPPRSEPVPRPARISAPSTLTPVKTFVLGAAATLLVVGGFWLYGKFAKEPVTPVVDAGKKTVDEISTKTKAAVTRVAGKDEGRTTVADKPPTRGRANLLSPEQGGKLLVASNERWNQVIDGKEDTYAWADDGFGVFGFRDGRAALLDTLTVLVPTQASTNIRDFELFVSNTAPTGPFESIGKFSTQNMRMMQDPYQAFRFTPVKAKYFKLQSLRSHDNSTTATLHEIQLFGELQ